MSYIFSITKATPKNIEALIRSMKVLSLEVALYPINLPCGLAWNDVMSSVVLSVLLGYVG